MPEKVSLTQIRERLAAEGDPWQAGVTSMSVLSPQEQGEISRLRKNSLVHWVKPVESTISSWAGEMPQREQFACPDPSKCGFRASQRSFQTSKLTLWKRPQKRFSAAC